MQHAKGASSADAWLENLTLEGRISDPAALAREADQMAAWDQRVRDAYAKLADRPGAWVMLSSLHRELGVVDRGEWEKGLRALDRHGVGVHLAPESNRKALRQEHHDTAVKMGDFMHIIAIQKPQAPYGPDIPGKDRPAADAPYTIIYRDSALGKPGAFAAYSDQIEPIRRQLEGRGAHVVRVEGQTAMNEQASPREALTPPKTPKAKAAAAPAAKKPARQPKQKRATRADTSAAWKDHDQVRKAFTELVSRPDGWVSLTRLRKHLGNPPKEEFDRVLRDLAGKPNVYLNPEFNQKSLTPEDRAAAVRSGGEDLHLIRFE